MTRTGALLAEFAREAATARRHLERLPDARFEWRPHPKSFTAGELAAHMIDCIRWVEPTFSADELDLDPKIYQPCDARSAAALLEIFDREVSRATQAMAGAADTSASQPWRLTMRGKVWFEKPREAVFRDMTLSHLVHHRGQFSVYLPARSAGARFVRADGGRPPLILMVDRIVDLTLDAPERIAQAAALLHEAFKNRARDWQDLDSARQEVSASIAPEKISRVALDTSGAVLGWIGGFPSYDGRVWELHPLVVTAARRRQGIGRALVLDLEQAAAARGALTLWVGSDDENDETSVSGVDLYVDVPAAIRGLTTLSGAHPREFYLRLGFRVAGLLPDANGRGKPDIFFAKRVGA